MSQALNSCLKLIIADDINDWPRNLKFGTNITLRGCTKILLIFAKPRISLGLVVISLEKWKLNEKKLNRKDAFELIDLD